MLAWLAQVEPPAGGTELTDLLLPLGAFAPCAVLGILAIRWLARRNEEKDGIIKDLNGQLVAQAQQSFRAAEVLDRAVISLVEQKATTDRLERAIDRVEGMDPRPAARRRASGS